MSDLDNYMKDTRAKKMSGFIASFEIFARYMKPTRNGEEEWLIAGAEHDVIYSCVDVDDCPEKSEDGQLLRALGWHEDEGAWAMFV